MRRAVSMLAMALVLATGCAHLQSPPLPPEAVHHRVRTADGWELALVQYPARGERAGRPVLLIHGISANARNMDLDEETSLARWLASQGREAWTVSLRGMGDSQRADPAAGREPGFTFDTLWQQDVTATIAHVREATGGAPIDAVAHSMGGMLLYAYLSQGGEGLARVVTLGSPTRLDHGSPVWSSALNLTGVIPAGWMVPNATLSPLVAPFQGGLQGDPLQLLLFNPENVAPSLWSRFLVTGVGDISGALLLQLAALARDGQFASADGSIDYRAGLARVKTPVLVVAGKRDRLCTPMAAWDAYRSLGGEKQWLLMGRENGAQADYGHLDYVIGARARFEVWPRILGFLDQRAPAVSVDQPAQR